jgi:dolichyl-phosphate-mannose-protein mannosyltransferase
MLQRKNLAEKWKEYSWLLLIVVVTLSLHLVLIPNPNTPIFDEQHFVPEANSILQGNGLLHPEHPSLGKLFIVSGIAIFGDNSFGWRFFSVLFGSLIIIFFYLLSRRLGMSKMAAVFATTILAFENLTFLQANVAMLDVYYVAFMMLAFWLFAKQKYTMSGVGIGLSTVSKLTGVFALPVIGFYWLMERKTKFLHILVTAVAAVASILIIMVPIDYIATRQLQNPVSRIVYMLNVTKSMTFDKYTHPYFSRPWEWVFQYQPMPYWYDPAYIAAINPFVWVFIIPSIGYLGYLAWKRNKAGIFGVAWFAGTYLLWIPASLLTNRISFLYYFYPSVGAVCLGIGLGLSHFYSVINSRGSRVARIAGISIISIYLLLVIGSFLAMSPLLAPAIIVP